MPLALKIAIDKPANSKESRACADLIQALDDLMTSNEVSPVTWTAGEDGNRLVFEAHIPADCLPEFDTVSDLLAESYSQYNKGQE